MKKLKIFSIALLTIALTGCEKFLDKKDPTSTSFDEFFNNGGKVCRRVTYSSYYDVFYKS